MGPRRDAGAMRLLLVVALAALAGPASASLAGVGTMTAPGCAPDSTRIAVLGTPVGGADQWLFVAQMFTPATTTSCLSAFHTGFFQGPWTPAGGCVPGPGPLDWQLCLEAPRPGPLGTTTYDVRPCFAPCAVQGTVDVVFA